MLLRLLIVAALVVGLGYAWQRGWISGAINSALDSGASAVKDTRSKAATLRPADAPPPEKKD